MTRTGEIFIKILQSALYGGEYTENFSADDWKAIFSLADSQLLLPIIFEAVRKNESLMAEKALFEYLKKRTIASVVRQTAKSVDFARLYAKFREKNLHPLVVKGRLCSRLYPMPDHRVSADDDIFVSDDELAECRSVLVEAGLNGEIPENEVADEMTYKNEFLYVELHRSLFDSGEGAPEDFNRFFVDVHKKRREIDGIFSMPAHEHMLYLILHSFKHFLYCGVGIRQTCDIAFWGREYAAEIDWELLLSQLSSVRADKFAAAQLRIATTRLGFEFDLPRVWQKMVDEADELPMLDDMFEGGVYGADSLSRLHSSTAVLTAVRAERTGENPGIVKSLFPGFEYMSGKYRYVKAHPILLPVGWAHRLISYATELRTKNSSASESLSVAKKRKALMKVYGIIK